MEEYLYGSKDGVHVFDLTKTKQHLEEALEVLKEASREGKNIVFVGTKKQAKEKIVEVAKRSGAFYINERWLGGIITNFQQIRRSTRKLSEMKQNFETGAYSEYTKKERLLLDREVKRLERFFGGIAELTDVPQLLIIIDTKREFGAVREALQAKVTTIGVVDSNSDPTLIDFPIPMNDDASKAVEYVLDLFADAIMEGKKSKDTKQAKSKESVKDEKAEKESKAKKEVEKSTKEKSKKAVKKTKKSEIEYN